VHRAKRRAGGNGRQVAYRKLQAGGGYGTIGQQTERLQPAARGRALLNIHRQEEISEQYRRKVFFPNFFSYLWDRWGFLFPI
jgi:hypothetical protein